MLKNKIFHCAVTNDLNQDQRMHRICTSIAKMGNRVVLIGRNKSNSSDLLEMPFQQHLIMCRFQRGLLFYLEYNIKLWWYLMKQKQDVIYSVDSDTLLACLLAKVLKQKKMIYDAHEYFTEVPELKGRPMIKRIWSIIESLAIPRADLAFTVNNSLANIYHNHFGITFHTIYNAPLLANHDFLEPSFPKFILYQGVLNKGRGLEALIQSMEFIPDVNLIIAGDGDIRDSLKLLAERLPSNDRIIFKGWLNPAELKILTGGAFLGINLLDGSSKNYFYSLANKFFDYLHAGVPSLNMKFPEYDLILDQYDVGYVVDDLNPEKIATVLRSALDDRQAFALKREACKKAAQIYNWQQEEKKLNNLLASL